MSCHVVIWTTAYERTHTHRPPSCHEKKKQNKALQLTISSRLVRVNEWIGSTTSTAVTGAHEAARVDE